MNPNLSDEDRAELARILRDVIEAERYPFSPKVKRRKELLSKLDREPERCVMPLPPPKTPAPPSHLLLKRRQG